MMKHLRLSIAAFGALALALVGCESDTADDGTGTDTGVEAPADTGADAPADTGADAPADTGADAPADTGAETTAPAG